MRLALILLVAAASLPLAAQPVTPQAACTYTDCALRIENQFFRGAVILQGVPGAERDLGGVGLFGGGLKDAVADVPEARGHAESAGRYRIGSAVAAVAGAVAVSLAVSRVYDSDNPAGYVGVYLAGVGLTVASGVLGVTSQNRQARAVWEYNRAVAGE